MLFIQGTRDKFAESQLLEPVVKRLGKYASLHQVQGAIIPTTCLYASAGVTAML
jgi:hypothetical protein